MYDNNDTAILEEESRRFARKLCQDRVGVDYLEQMKDRKRQNEARMANLKKGSEIDMKVLLANVGNHSGKLLELVYMNHTSTAKARKAVKK